MSKIIGVTESTIGLALIFLALLPTPDDVTIVSPVAQFGLGLYLIGEGIKDIKQ